MKYYFYRGMFFKLSKMIKNWTKSLKLSKMIKIEQNPLNYQKLKKSFKLSKKWKIT